MRVVSMRSERLGGLYASLLFIQYFLEATIGPERSEGPSLNVADSSGLLRSNDARISPSRVASKGRSVIATKRHIVQ